MTTTELYMIISAVLFCFGLFGVLTFHDKIRRLIYLEMMYLGVVLVFALFAKNLESSVYLYIIIFINSIHIILMGLHNETDSTAIKEPATGEKQ